MLVYKKLKWSPAIPVKPKDFIISSDAVARGIKPFEASYEKDCKVNMTHIMSYEYQRRWYRERAEHRRGIHQQDATKSTSQNKRRYINRTTKRVNVYTMPIIHLKRFENIPAKVDTNLGHNKKSQ